MLNPIHFIPGEIRYHSQFGKIGIGKLINKPRICRNDFVECCVKVIHQIRTVLRDRQIIVGLANPGKGNHVRILLNGIIRIYRSICQIGLEITVTRIIAAISEDVQLIIPSLIPTYFVLLIMSIGNFLNTGVDQYLTFGNALNKQYIEVLDLYVYNLGIGSGQISFSVAVGIMKSVVALVLFSSANLASKKIRGESVF